LTKLNFPAASPEHEYPYVLEDFGVLQLQEYVEIARVANASSSHCSMQLFTVDTQDPDNIKMTVYKIKRLYQTITQIIKDKIK
jgi:hypothetical protein